MPKLRIQLSRQCHPKDSCEENISCNCKRHFNESKAAIGNFRVLFFSISHISRGQAPLGQPGQSRGGKRYTKEKEKRGGEETK